MALILVYAVGLTAASLVRESFREERRLVCQLLHGFVNSASCQEPAIGLCHSKTGLL